MLKPFPHGRSLSVYFSITLLFAFLVAVGALLMVYRLVVVPQLLTAEVGMARDHVDRIKRAIERELDHVDTTNRDYATWNNTYRFMTGQEPDYPRRHLGPATLEHANMTFMLFFDKRMNLRRVEGKAPGTDAFTACTASTASCAWAAPAVAAVRKMIASRDSAVTGRALLAGPRPAFITWRPILPTDGGADAAGVLAIGRMITSQWLEDVAAQTGTEFRLEQRRPVREGSTDDTLKIHRMEASHLLASVGLGTAPTAWRLFLEARVPREAFRRSQTLARFALYWTAGLFATVLLITHLILRRVVLSPLKQLAAHASQQEDKENYSSPPEELLRREDELGTLAREYTELIQRVAVRTAELSLLSYRDVLTGVYNRRFFEERLAENFALAQRTRQSISLLMCDVDFFKAFNDIYGHGEGDRCLRAVAECLEIMSRRKSDVVARYGGEEFVVLLPGLQADEAVRVAENIRIAVEDLALRHGGSACAAVVTLSIGVASVVPALSDSRARLLQSADEALYRAKAAGRNRVHGPGGAHRRETA